MLVWSSDCDFILVIEGLPTPQTPRNKPQTQLLHWHLKLQLLLQWGLLWQQEIVRSAGAASVAPPPPRNTSMFGSRVLKSFPQALVY
eukprot:3873431-Amphidinium_carterae.1